MPAADLNLLAINIATLSVLFFSANLLVVRTDKNHTYFPLALSFIGVAIVICQPSLKVLAPALQLSTLTLALPALLLIAPCFWLYVKGLTHNTLWRFEKSDIRHLALPGLGLLISLVTFWLPAEIHYSLLGKGDIAILEQTSALFRNFIYGLLIATFVLVLGWIAQSAFYLIKIIKRLQHYRNQLKQVFASTETKEIRWLSGLLLFIGIAWAFAAINLLLDNLFIASEFTQDTFQFVLLITVCFIATWGLRQKPGFEELYSTEPVDVEHQVSLAVDNENSQVKESENVSSEKYKRSALTAEMAENIAQKMEAAMASEQLYLDANLSLPKLAKLIHTSPNYISQTLNETLATNFFDYVNHKRIVAAQKLLLESELTVLDIAMQVGFNSKSAFYSAFKKYSQLTPSQFKQLSK
ncbi:helix-turn-helix transcriptional regulator [Pseudoalteromonas sp. SS15]|uniref:helix-turn-helix transcriptional regulator n=1 Tax=Pseudoalteromonas sp. SS15 TaxID=3139393 RepID=UPI003BADA51B